VFDSLPRRLKRISKFPFGGDVQQLTVPSALFEGLAGVDADIDAVRWVFTPTLKPSTEELT